MLYRIPLRLSKTVCRLLSEAVQLSVTTKLVPALGTMEVGLKTVSTPSVTIPSLVPIGCCKLPKVHIVEESTAPLNRHLKHVCTPPSTMMMVSNEELVVMLKVSPHCCELPVEGKVCRMMCWRQQKYVHQQKYIHPLLSSTQTHTFQQKFMINCILCCIISQWKASAVSLTWKVNLIYHTFILSSPTHLRRKY